MRYSGWFLTLGFLTVGLGFGHAGCYTSGTPGGLAVGGSDAGVTSNSNQGGSSQDGDSGADASDSGPDASDVGKPCVDSRDCSHEQAHEQVCDLASHQCVGCISDADCVLTSERCAQHSCLSIVRCISDKQCTPSDQICDTTRTYCVHCIDYKNCLAGKSCVEGLCIDTLTSDAG